MTADELYDIKKNLNAFGYQLFFRVDYLTWHIRVHENKVVDLVILLHLYTGCFEKNKAH